MAESNWLSIEAHKGALESLIDSTVKDAARSLGIEIQVAVAITCAKNVDLHLLHPEETVILRSLGSPGTRLRWAMGRQAAHAAIARFGIKKSPIMRGLVGDPIWPHGVTGSITHSSPWS